MGVRVTHNAKKLKSDSPVGEVRRVGLASRPLSDDLGRGVAHGGLLRDLRVVVRTLHDLCSVDREQGGERHSSEEHGVAEAEHVGEVANRDREVSTEGRVVQHPCLRSTN